MKQRKETSLVKRKERTCDVDFMFKLATDITDLMLKWQEKAESAELGEDNPEDLEAVRETINQFS